MKVKKLVAFVLLFFGAQFVVAQETSARSGSVSEDQISKGATGDNWPSYGGKDSAWRYSSLNQIDTTNVKKLAPAWIFQTGDYEDALQSTPIVMDGIVYVSTARDWVYALNGATGSIVWQYKYAPIPGTSPSARVKNYGVAVADGKVYIGTYDDYVVALDQKTGREVWKVAAEDSTSCRCRISAAPLIVKDKVVISSSGPRGFIAAFSQNDGHMDWRFYTVAGPEAPEANKTWPGDSWKKGGVDPWITGSYDPELNLIYWGTGDPNPTFFGASRQGINLYSCSIVALDADTGKLRWYTQEVPHDSWDFDSIYESVLIDREVDGRMRKLLVHINKGGYSWVLDRVTGEVVNTYPDNDYINWVDKVTKKGVLVGRHDVLENKPPFLICPSNLAGKQWNQTAYSPRTTWIYIPMNEMCNDIVARPPIEGLPDSGGGTWVMKPPPGHAAPYAHIDAFDPVTGEHKWRYDYKYAFLASMLATAGNLVFTGDPEGHFFALDAETGKQLWSFQTGAGHRGSSVTYMAGGKQYVLTPTGWGSVSADIMSVLWTESSEWRMGSTLVAFALPEDSK